MTGFVPFSHSVHCGGRGLWQVLYHSLTVCIVVDEVYDRLCTILSQCALWWTRFMTGFVPFSHSVHCGGRGLWQVLYHSLTVCIVVDEVYDRFCTILSQCALWWTRFMTDYLIIIIIIIIIIVIIIIIIIIAFKGAIRDFVQSPPSAANCLQHVHSSGPGAIMCKSLATHRAFITCNISCYVPLGTNGQLSY